MEAVSEGAGKGKPPAAVAGAGCALIGSLARELRGSLGELKIQLNRLLQEPGPPMDGPALEHLRQVVRICDELIDLTEQPLASSPSPDADPSRADAALPADAAQHQHGPATSKPSPSLRSRTPAR